MTIEIFVSFVIGVLVGFSISAVLAYNAMKPPDMTKPPPPTGWRFFDDKPGGD